MRRVRKCLVCALACAGIAGLSYISSTAYLTDSGKYHFLPGDEIQFTEAWAYQTLPATFTFCAQWLPNILVRYDLNGGSGTTPASKTGTYLDGYPISETQGFSKISTRLLTVLTTCDITQLSLGCYITNRTIKQQS